MVDDFSPTRAEQWKKVQTLCDLAMFRIQLTKRAFDEITTCGTTVEDFEAYLNKQERKMMYPTWDSRREKSGFKLVAGKAAVLLKHNETSDPDSDALATSVRYGDSEHERMEENYEQNPFRLLAVDESLVVDGANIVMEGTGHKALKPHKQQQKCPNPGSLWRLLQVLEQEKELEKRDRLCVVVDARLRHHIDDEAKLEELINAKRVIQSPACRHADPLILQLAKEKNAVVLTNDTRMRYDAQKFPWVTNEARFIRFVLVSDENKHIEYTRKVPAQSVLLKSLVRLLPPLNRESLPSLIEEPRNPNEGEGEHGSLRNWYDQEGHHL
jgi:hypothetical protein